MYSRIRFGTVLIAALLATGVADASFTASDLVYVPVVAHNPGEEDSLWRSDVTITNVEGSGVHIDVMLTLIPSGQQSNTYLFSSRDYWLGGNSADLFGMIDERLSDIPPGGSVLLEDVVGEYFIDDPAFTSSGALVFFAYETGSLQEDGSRIPANMVVNSRTYNQTTIWEPDPENAGDFIESDATYGQVMPGVPWYNFADSGAVSENGNLSFMGLTGGTVTEDTRYNVGLVNGSDAQTTLTVVIQPLHADGSAYVTEDGVVIKLVSVLPPISQLQYNSIYKSIFFIDEAETTTLKVSIQSFTTSGVNPIPLLTTYGSVVDNRSNDPTTVLPTFTVPYDVECMWGSVYPETKRMPGAGSSDLAPFGRPVQAPPVAGN